MRDYLPVRVRTCLSAPHRQAQTGTKLRAFELADGVVLLIYLATWEFPNIPAVNQKLWRRRRFWAPCFDQCADSVDLEN